MGGVCVKILLKIVFRKKLNFKKPVKNTFFLAKERQQAMGKAILFFKVQIVVSLREGTLVCTICGNYVA